MSSTKPSKHPIMRTFKVPISPDGSTRAIHITEPAYIKADNLTLETWASSQVLSGVLHELNLHESLPGPDSYDTSIPLLELGAGTALVGLTAVSLAPAEAIFTDLRGIVPGILANIDANRDLVAGVPVTAGALDWTDPDYIELADGTRISAARGARIMFAADTVYDERHPELLEDTVTRWLERDRRAMFVICYSLRVAYLDHVRELWERFERRGLTATKEGRVVGEVTNGDDELLCEWVVWQWSEEALEKKSG